MGYRLDAQNYATGKLALDAQTYVAGVSTTQYVFVDVYLLPNALQTYTKGATSTTQYGTGPLTVSAGAAQNYLVAGNTDSTHTGAGLLTLTALAPQSYVRVPTIAVQSGAARITLTATGAQNYSYLRPAGGRLVRVRRLLRIVSAKFKFGRSLTMHSKTALENWNYGFDYRDVIALDDPIDISVWVIPAGLSVGAQGSDATSTSVTLGGGTVGQRYICTNRITTVLGFVAERSLVLTIVAGIYN